MLLSTASWKESVARMGSNLFPELICNRARMNCLICTRRVLDRLLVKNFLTGRSSKHWNFLLGDGGCHPGRFLKDV